LAGWTIVLGNFSVFATGLGCVAGSRRAAAARQLATEIASEPGTLLNYAFIYSAMNLLIFDESKLLKLLV
jgi:hypothetical protein